MTDFQSGYADAYCPASVRNYPNPPSYVPADADCTLEEARAEYMKGFCLGQAEYNANRKG